jgi:PAP2 superfamily
MARVHPRRFALRELALWASIYPAYLAIRSATIGNPAEATAHATQIVDLERAVDLFHERWLQHSVASVADFFSVYYIAGFGPLLAAVLIWLGLHDGTYYRQLRTLLFVSLAIAIAFYVFFPTAPPRLVPGLGFADTVGMSSHDTGSVFGIRFNPYAAMPSMHVGWSLLVAYVATRVARRRWLRALIWAHPLVMAITVTATGNHYFLDSLAGATAAVAAIGLLAGARRLRPSRQEAEVIPFPVRSHREEIRRAA